MSIRSAGNKIFKLRLIYIWSLKMPKGCSLSRMQHPWQKQTVLVWNLPACHLLHFDKSIKMCPHFLQRRLCIAKQSVAPFPCYLNEDRLLPHSPDPGGRYGQDRPPGPRTEEQVRARHRPAQPEKLSVVKKTQSALWHHRSSLICQILAALHQSKFCSVSCFHFSPNS